MNAGPGIAAAAPHVSAMRMLAVLSLLLTLAACAGIQAQLNDQADPRHHPFHSYGASG
jgi:hypothetical protein